MDIQESFAKTIGREIGETMAVFAAVISVLRNQPNFDNEQFESDIRELINRTKPDNNARLLLSMLLDEKESSMEIDLNNPNEFTIENIRKMIRSGDDSRNSQIRVREDGIVYLSYVVGNEDLEGLQFRLESFSAGSGYVGVKASEDEAWIERLYSALKQNWSSKTRGYLDVWFD